MGVAPQYGQPTNASMKPNHQNLMDEIGNSCVRCIYLVDVLVTVAYARGLDGNSIKATNSTTIMRVMRTVNLILAIATIVAGLLAWIMGYVSSFQKVIAGIYIMCVENAWLCVSTNY